MSAPALIGGFFPLTEPAPACSASVAQVWGLPASAAQGFWCARAALRALLAHVRPKRLWLPAYLCPSLVQAAQDVPTEFFAIDAKLEPDVAQLGRALMAGDAVLAINYFGRAPSAEFIALTATWPDITFIEDCAQALDTAQPAWGAWRLYSPRKLLGVADGGYVVPMRGQTLHWQTTAAPPAQASLLAKAPALRQQQPQANQVWHPLNQQREAAMTAAPWQVSAQTHALLGQLDHAQIAQQRRANYAILAAQLSDYAFLSDTQPAFAPLGFPVRVAPALRNRLRMQLIEAGIFPAVHWPEIAAPAARFALAHQLAQELLTLPCDQRYNAQDMQRIIAVIQTAAQAA